MIRTDLFSKNMTHKFCDFYILWIPNNNQPGNNRLWKIRDIFENLNDKFTRYFSPFQKLCIDESLVMFKGRL